MNKVGFLRLSHCCGLLLGFIFHCQAYAQVAPNTNCRNEIEKIEHADKTGPFAVYQLDDKKILVEIKNNDLDKEFIYTTYIDRGVIPFVGQYSEPKLLTFRRKGKQIEIIEKDSVGFFKEEEAISRTRTLTMSDAVIGSLKLHKCKPDGTQFAIFDQSVLTKLSSSFLGAFRRGGSQVAAELKDWRSYSDNINFISEHRLSSSSRSNFSIQVRHILFKRPEEVFKSRIADPRIGFFTSNRRNLGDFDQSASETYIHKWRLEKKDPTAALSEPVKPIVFWIESTTPEKFRPYIKQGVLAWNEAFRAAGFLNAVEVYEQPFEADWEAGEISKNVIRWQSSSRQLSTIGFAPAMHDPVTGEILGADILLNYAGVGDYIDDWSRLSGEDSLTPLDAVSHNALQRDIQLELRPESKISNSSMLNVEKVESRLEGLYVLASLIGTNQNISEKRVLESVSKKIQSPVNAQPAAGEEVHDAASMVEGLNFADRMVKEFIIDLTMHEVGHALGLTHNFRGSRWRSMDEIYTREKTNGVISASVMDYVPINFSPIGSEQGDFANTRLGPYDIWAIDFGYRPDFSAAERIDLLEQAKKPEYAFSDRVFKGEPDTLQHDLTSTPIKYAESRLKFVSDVTKFAPLNDSFIDQRQYVSLFRDLQSEILLSVGTIAAQVEPFTSSVTLIDGESSGFFQTVNVRGKIEQKEALKALERLVFRVGALPFSEEFVHRLGYNLHAAKSFPVDVQRLVLMQLMHERSLMLMYNATEYGGEYNPTEFLFDLKRAVFGSDLKLFARGSLERREQQLLFAENLAGLISERASGGRSRYVVGAIVSAAARPVRNELLRELLTPTPWASMQVRAHRQELRAILQ